jgi:hypothetical protein
MMRIQYPIRFMALCLGLSLFTIAAIAQEAVSYTHLTLPTSP